MASKAEWKRQERRDKEREYWRPFIARLNEATTVAATARVALEAMPGVNGTGRRRHTNLIHLLGGAQATGAQPPFRVLRDCPLAPWGAASEERAAYTALFKRLAQSGEISQEDAEYAAQVLSPTRGGFVDLI